MQFYFDLFIGIIHFYVLRFTCSKYVYIAKARYDLTMKFTYQVLKMKGGALIHDWRDRFDDCTRMNTQSQDGKRETCNYLYYIQLA